MEIWTTFTPRKVCWELTYVKTKGNSVSSNWIINIELIEKSLNILRRAGISGIRLVIYPSEIANDGREYDWHAVDKMLIMCAKYNLMVDLCIGPFQYPNYPGIYIPPYLIKNVPKASLYIDDDPFLEEFGRKFVQMQLVRYGDDKRVHGFHLGNEWPDMQRVEGVNDVKLTVSEEFMLNIVSSIKILTHKPIHMNTNIDIFDIKKLRNIFNSILKELGSRAWLGFDIYPTQDKWKKHPFQKLRNLINNYSEAFLTLENEFPKCKMYFAEVEAQPWGSGQAWYRIIKNEETPDKKILNYYKNSLKKTIDKYIKGTSCKKVSLWGADFWLSAYEMKILWPLDQIKSIN